MEDTLTSSYPQTDVHTLPLTIRELQEAGVLPQDYIDGQPSSFLSPLGALPVEHVCPIDQPTAFREAYDFYRREKSYPGPLLRVDTPNGHFFVVPGRAARPGEKSRGKMYSELHAHTRALESGRKALLPGQEVTLPNGRSAPYHGCIHTTVQALTLGADKNMYAFARKEQLGFDKKYGVPYQVNFRPYGFNYQALAALRLVQGTDGNFFSVAFPFAGPFLADLIHNAAENTKGSIIAVANRAGYTINRCHTNYVKFPSQSMITKSIARHRRKYGEGAIIGLNHGDNSGIASNITVLSNTEEAIRYNAYLESIGYAALVGTTQGETFVAPRRFGLPKTFQLFSQCGDEKALHVMPGYEQVLVHFDDGETNYDHVEDGYVIRHGVKISTETIFEELVAGLNSVVAPIEEQRKIYNDFVAANYQIPAAVLRVLNAPKVTGKQRDEEARLEMPSRQMPQHARQVAAAYANA